MINKIIKIKGLLSLILVTAFCMTTMGAVVGDNDGSAFITKAEFDSLKNSFQSQIDQYNTSIDSKIDGAIASYLAGIKNERSEELHLTTNAIKDIVWRNYPNWFLRGYMQDGGWITNGHSIVYDRESRLSWLQDSGFWGKYSFVDKNLWFTSGSNWITSTSSNGGYNAFSAIPFWILCINHTSYSYGLEKGWAAGKHFTVTPTMPGWSWLRNDFSGSNFVSLARHIVGGEVALLGVSDVLLTARPLVIAQTDDNPGFVCNVNSNDTFVQYNFGDYTGYSYSLTRSIYLYDSYSTSPSTSNYKRDWAIFLRCSFWDFYSNSWASIQTQISFSEWKPILKNMGIDGAYNRTSHFVKKSNGEFISGTNSYISLWKGSLESTFLTNDRGRVLCSEGFESIMWGQPLDDYYIHLYKTRGYDFKMLDTQFDFDRTDPVRFSISKLNTVSDLKLWNSSWRSFTGATAPASWYYVSWFGGTLPKWNNIKKLKDMRNYLLACNGRYVKFCEGVPLCDVNVDGVASISIKADFKYLNSVWCEHDYYIHSEYAVSYEQRPTSGNVVLHLHEGPFENVSGNGRTLKLCDKDGVESTDFAEYIQADDNGWFKVNINCRRDRTIYAKLEMINADDRGVDYAQITDFVGSVRVAED